MRIKRPPKTSRRDESAKKRHAVEADQGRFAGRSVTCLMSLSLVRAMAFGAALIATAALQAERVFPVSGIVRSAFADGSVVVTHEEIVGYMPAMTMRFKVADAARAQAVQLQPGDRVAFSLYVDAETERADGFRVLGHAAEPASRAATNVAVRRVHEGDVMPAFTLIDEQSRPFTPARLSGHLTVLTFIFTRCPVAEFCPLMARRFGELQHAIKADAQLRGRAELLSITLDPEFDRPDVLAAYGHAVGAEPAVWHFATGTTNDVTALVKAFSVYTERNGAALDHTLCTALIDSSGRIVNLWRGNAWSTSEVLEALRGSK